MNYEYMTRDELIVELEKKDKIIKNRDIKINDLLKIKDEQWFLYFNLIDYDTWFY